MFYYEVAPASRQYQGSTLLTYSSEAELSVGQIIVVKIRGRETAAFVVRSVGKPEFKTAPIESVTELELSPRQLELFTWMQDYYPSPVGVIAQLFLPLPKVKDYLHTPKSLEADTSLKVNELPQLTDEQKQAVSKLSGAEAAVLHGATGSGKTRVYIELARKAVEAGRSAVILVPEIALSPQIVASFTQALEVPVIVTHSGLTPVQRRNAWLQIAAADKPIVVIGPRSALFTPVNNVGLVVVDEFHEGAYKQDQAPYYQTLRVAGKFARLSEALLVMGSATPPISEYYIAENRGLPIIRMDQKAAGGEAKLKITVVNLKDDSERTRAPLISHTLSAAISAALARGDQTLLFLNKRGSARVILCQNCGWHAVCERCDLPMTYHADGHRLACHTCGNRSPAPNICPDCSSHDIMFKSPGTKAIAEAVQKLFPEAVVGRFDKDNLKAERLESRHADVVSGQIDILVGTQLLAKGHDLPKLGLVGVLLAENELQFPDYTSSERSYQLMRQLIGRVGRGHRAGEVILQTYDPLGEAVRGATGQKTWQEFYDSQIEERRLFRFPPFFFLMKIEVSAARLETVQANCEKIIKFIGDSGEPVSVAGPMPSFIEKRGGVYHWQIIVRARQRPALERLATSLPTKATINLDPANLL